MINAFLGSLLTLIVTIITLYKWVIIIDAILSFVRPDPYNPVVQLLHRLTAPVYKYIRKFIPTIIGGLDLAPLILLFVLVFLENFLLRLQF